MKKLDQIYQRNAFFLEAQDYAKANKLGVFRKVPLKLCFVKLFKTKNRLHLNVRSFAFKSSLVKRLFWKFWFWSNKLKLKSYESKSKLGCSSSKGINLYACRPHTGAGFGHRMSTVISGLILARDLNSRLVITGLPDYWDKYLGLDSFIGERNYSIDHQLKLPSNTFLQIPDFERILSELRSSREKGNILVWGPLDHTDFSLLDGGNILRDIFTKVHGHEPVYPSRLAVHVRRSRGAGDNLHGRRQIDLSEVIGCLEENESLLSEAKEIVILCTDEKEGTKWVKELREFSKGKVSTTSGCCERGAFDLLANSAMMIGSASGFSYSAALVSRGTVVFPKNFWHQLDSHWLQY